MHAPDATTSPIRFERLAGSRIVATPAALNELSRPTDSIALRFAPDELYVTPPLEASDLARLAAADPHAIIVSEMAFSGAWLEEDHARRLFERYAEWEMPPKGTQAQFVQGSVAGVATKIYFAAGNVLLLVQSPYAHELEERLT